MFVSGPLIRPYVTFENAEEFSVFGVVCSSNKFGYFFDPRCPGHSVITGLGKQGNKSP